MAGHTTAMETFNCFRDDELVPEAARAAARAVLGEELNATRTWGDVKRVLATVVSANSRHVIIDAGSKVLSSDKGAHGTSVGDVQYGMAFKADEGYSAEGFAGAAWLPVSALSEEHGWLKRGEVELAVGDRVLILPNHSCPVANLADEYVVVGSSGMAEEVWRVDARGKVR